jgi:hypothetical protein
LDKNQFPSPYRPPAEAIKKVGIIHTRLFANKSATLVAPPRSQTLPPVAAAGIRKTVDGTWPER